MKYDDLSFEMVNDDGIEVICDILEVVPNNLNDDEPYVIYTDYMLDENNGFKRYYGKLIKVDGEFVLKRIKGTNLINEIIQLSNDPVVKYVNKEVDNNRHE